VLNQIDFNKLKDQDTVLHYCVLSKYETRPTKTGNQYLQIEVKDKSTSLIGRMWGGFENVLPELKPGLIIKIKGTAELYQNSINLKIEQLRLTQPADNIVISDFLPSSTRSLDEMKSELNEVLNSITNIHLSKLVKTIFDTHTIEKFASSPAAKNWHHAYIGGLIEHTLEIIKICDLMCKIHTNIKRDLLICGALFHDFGKLKELNVNTDIYYTDEGKLIGHIVLGAMEVESKIKEIPNFPDKLKNDLLHLILSHQGKLEFATPVVPKTLEAIVLYQADELSAKTNAYKYSINSADNTQGNWTKFIQLAGTDLYLRNYEL